MKTIIAYLSKRRMAFLSGAGVILLAILIALFKGGGVGGKSVTIRTGDLESVVTGRGEISGEKSVRISLDPLLQNYELRVWSYKIIELVQEGKRVKKGDFIAQLDQSELTNNMRQRMIEMERFDVDMKNAVIDSTVNLTARREDIVNATLDLQYRQIDVDVSAFESGAQQRKAMMAYQKAEIALDKKKRDYVLEQNRLKIRLRRYGENAKNLQTLIDRYQKAIALTRITSPGDGIVVIDEDFLGKKLTKDSQISLWRPNIAMLPDMSSVVVTTYIKEIDITKIHQGDSARITVDALPGKILSGKVYKIANMGETKKGFDMNAFEVIVRLDHSDPDLKPGMTCNNDIVVNKFRQVVLVPLKSVFRENNSCYIYVQDGGKITKRTVELGAENEQDVVVLDGVKAGEKVLLYEPGKL